MVDIQIRPFNERQQNDLILALLPSKELSATTYTRVGVSIAC